MGKHLVSLCVIARDEQELLPRCLRSAVTFADEIVLVDSGSSDATVERAVQLGARVLRHVWTDDFAEARNVALDAASGRFVLVLDADEWIEDGCPVRAIRRRLRTTAEEAFSVLIRDRLDGGAERSYPLVRLFRNRPEYRYQGAIHEQITPSIARKLDRRELRPVPSGLVLGHDGYLRERLADRGKHERNLRMLLRRVEAFPEDAASRYFLVREMVPIRGGRAVPGDHLREALEHCVRLSALRDALPAPLAEDFARLHSAALLGVGRAADAGRILQDRGGSSVACELLRADAELGRADADPAGAAGPLERIRRCFDRDDHGRLPFEEPAIAGPIARSHAVEILIRLGRLEEARSLAEQAAALPGGGSTPWNARAAVERAAGDRLSALRFYMEGLRSDPHDPWCWAGLGQVLLGAGRADHAVEALSNATSLAPGWPPVEEALASARALAGPQAHSDLSDEKQMTRED